MSVVARDAGPGHWMLFHAPRRSVPVFRGTEATFSHQASPYPSLSLFQTGSVHDACDRVFTFYQKRLANDGCDTCFDVTGIKCNLRKDIEGKALNAIDLKHAALARFQWTAINTVHCYSLSIYLPLLLRLHHHQSTSYKFHNLLYTRSTNSL